MKTKIRQASNTNSGFNKASFLFEIRPAHIGTIPILFVLLLLGLPAHAVNTYYAIRDLGGTDSWGLGINDNGQVTGISRFSGYTHAVTMQNGTITDLGTLGGRDSVGHGINASGQVTGWSLTSTNAQHAFITRNGVMTDLGTLYDGGNSGGNGINASGQVTGWAHTTSGTHAFITQNGTMTDLGTLGGTCYGGLTFEEGKAINASGQVTGYSYTTSCEKHAFITQNGIMTDLGTLGGGYSKGNGINASGQVTGYSYTANGEFHAFVTQNGIMTDLGSLGGKDSFGYGINDFGVVVGDYVTSFDSNNDPITHAFISQDGVMTDLNNLIDHNTGWELASASAINNKGQITGWGRIAGKAHTFLLTPPSTSLPHVEIQPSALVDDHAGTGIHMVKAKAIISGGQPPFNYWWTVGEPIVISNPAGSITNLSAKLRVLCEDVTDQATVTVTDAAGFQSQAIALIRLFSKPPRGSTCP